MTALTYLKALTTALNGTTAFDSGSFKAMLLTNSYTPNETTQSFRSAIAAKEVTGAGYTAGGAAATVSTSLDAPNSRALITFGATTFSSSTITARHAVYYLNTGNASTDVLVFNNQFSQDYSSVNGDFSLLTGNQIAINMGEKTYFSAGLDIANGDIDFDTDTFKYVLLDNTYTPDQNHDRRSDLTGEVSGAGYTTGGITIVPAISEDTVNKKSIVTFPSSVLTGTTLTNVRYQVFFKSTGTAANDRLICWVDFGNNLNPSNVNLTLLASTFSLSLVAP